MKKYIFCIFLITAIAGCKTDYKKALDGEWVFKNTDKDIVRYFTHIQFKGDSIFLKDADYINYSSSYKIKGGTIYIGETTSEFKILNDSTIELLDQIFAKKGYIHATGTYSNYEDVCIKLPDHILLEDTGKIFPASDKGERTQNISIGTDKNKESVLLINNYKANFHDLKIFLESNKADEFTIAKFNIDKAVEMGFLDSTLSVLDQLGVHRLSFASGYNLNNYIKPIHQLKTLQTIHPYSYSRHIVSDIFLFYTTKEKGSQHLINIENNTLSFDGLNIDSLGLFKSIRTFFDAPAPKPTLILLYNSFTTYDTFFKYLSAIHNFYYILRSDLSHKKFNASYNDLSPEKQKEIRQMIPKKVHFFNINLYNELKEIPFPYCDF